MQNVAFLKRVGKYRKFVLFVKLNFDVKGKVLDNI